MMRILAGVQKLCGSNSPNVCGKRLANQGTLLLISGIN